MGLSGLSVDGEIAQVHRLGHFLLLVGQIEHFDDCLRDLLFLRGFTHFDWFELESLLVALIGQNAVVGSILYDS